MIYEKTALSIVIWKALQTKKLQGQQNARVLLQFSTKSTLGSQKFTSFLAVPIQDVHFHTRIIYSNYCVLVFNINWWVKFFSSLQVFHFFLH